MVSSFSTNLGNVGQTTIIQDPYIRADIEAKDRSNWHYSLIQTWTASNSNIEFVVDKGISTVGLKSSDPSQLLELTRTIDIPENGYYHIYIHALRRPGDVGTITVYADNVQVDEPVDVNFTYSHAKRFDFGRVYLRQGDVDFKIKCLGYPKVSMFILQKVDLFSSDNISHSNRIELKRAYFTVNSINEINHAELDIYATENLFWDNNPNNLRFDFQDQITIYLGGKKRTAKPYFGGYISGNDIPEDSVVFYGLDRLMNLCQEPLYFKYAIGGASHSTETSDIPFIELPNVYETARFLIETCGDGIDSSLISNQYGLNYTFTNNEYYRITTSGGFDKRIESGVGDPAPSVSFGITNTGASEIVLFDSSFDGQPIDATRMQVMSLKYNCGSNPFKFHFKITMYKENESIEDAIDYYINFSGTESYDNAIGAMTYTFNNTWQEGRIDLMQQFDSYAPSLNYYITKISMVANVSYDDYVNRNNIRFYLDNFTLYDRDHNTSMVIENGVSTGYDVLKELLKANHLVGKVHYGSERRFDRFELVPEISEISEEFVIEGKNLITIPIFEYIPFDKICNISTKQYSISDTQTGQQTSTDIEHRAYYGFWKRHENLDSTTNETVALQQAIAQVQEGTNMEPELVVKVAGSVLTEMGQLKSVSIPSKRIYGNYMVKSLEHDISLENDPTYFTVIGLNRPSSRFLNLMKNLNNAINNFKNTNSRTLYTNESLHTFGIINPGGFVIN